MLLDKFFAKGKRLNINGKRGIMWKMVKPQIKKLWKLLLKNEENLTIFKRIKTDYTGKCGELHD
jgi:hypothetical protein